MGQRRPKPEEPRSGYITSEGYARMSEEFEQLYRVERPKVVKGVAVAAAEGDRSENAEYIYGKKKLREIDRRLRHLGQRLNAVTVVEPNEDRDDGKVYFGAWVRLESESGEGSMFATLAGDWAIPSAKDAEGGEDGLEFSRHAPRTRQTEYVSNY